MTAIERTIEWPFLPGSCPLTAYQRSGCAGALARQFQFQTLTNSVISGWSPTWQLQWP